MATSGAARRIIRRIVGNPVASGRVPARLPLALERHQVLFDTMSVPPLPTPVLIVHTGGKPMAYVAADGRQPRQSMPGLVTFLPARVRSEAVLRGVGEGTVVYFDDAATMPAWLLRSRYAGPVTFANDVIVAITRRLMHELESGSGTDAYLKSLANALIAELQRELRHPESVVSPAASRSELRIAHAAMEHISARLGNRLTVAELARACGVGVTAFSGSFREATGVTPHRYLRKARLERAGELLRTTGLTVREIAEAVGFRGQGHFCTAFVAERGMTPTAYRRTSRTDGKNLPARSRHRNEKPRRGAGA